MRDGKLIIYRTGDPIKGNAPEVLSYSEMKAFRFAAPTPEIAGRWANYIWLNSYGPPVAVEVSRAYHRYISGYDYPQHVEESEFWPNPPEWDGDIENLIDGEDKDLCLKEIIFHPKDVINVRNLNDQELREYTRGFYQFDNYAKSKARKIYA